MGYLDGMPININNCPSFHEALKIWVKFAIYIIDGPNGKIVVRHKFLVGEKKWIGKTGSFTNLIISCFYLSLMSKIWSAILDGFCTEMDGPGMVDTTPVPPGITLIALIDYFDLKLKMLKTIWFCITLGLIVRLLIL